MKCFAERNVFSEEIGPGSELARVIVQSGWNLTELRSVGESLEEIFLELTKSETVKETKEEEAVAL